MFRASSNDFTKIARSHIGARETAADNRTTAPVVMDKAHTGVVRTYVPVNQSAGRGRGLRRGSDAIKSRLLRRSMVTQSISRITNLLTLRLQRFPARIATKPRSGLGGTIDLTLRDLRNAMGRE